MFNPGFQFIEINAFEKTLEEPGIESSFEKFRIAEDHAA